ncbi:hypothetical protein REPUB_Repub02eG0284400 [Reevesia pubescens]
MASIACLTVIFCFFPLLALAQSVEFVFNGFNASETNLTTEGASIIKPTGALRLTNKSHHVIGHAFYYEPIQMFDINSSFSTSFVFEIVPSSSEQGGYGLEFSSRNQRICSRDRKLRKIKAQALAVRYHQRHCCRAIILHEEWEQVVIHRDVKSSNVLIDAEMNARLGDFGLARLYDHGTASHTTNVVGTIGYIAPELARNGKASNSADVFAFGVLLLEIATGKGLQVQQISRILDAADPKLNSDYAVEEMELVLGLGLLCSHERPDSRPTMRRVMRYLNGDDLLPFIDWSSIDSKSISETNSRLLEGISKDTIMTSYHSLSIGSISSSCISTGR